MFNGIKDESKTSPSSSMPAAEQEAPNIINLASYRLARQRSATQTTDTEIAIPKRQTETAPDTSSWRTLLEKADSAVALPLGALTGTGFLVWATQAGPAVPKIIIGVALLGVTAVSAYSNWRENQN